MRHRVLLAPRHLPVVCALGLVALFEPTVYVQPAFDAKAAYDKRELTIPMRDGTRLFTIVYSPKDQSRRYPILLTRTAYGIPPYGPDTYRASDRPEHRVRRSRLHRRLPRRPREVQVGGRVHPPLAHHRGLDQAEREHRHLRHDRLAREERPQQQRPRRAMGHLLGWLASLDGHDRRAPGASRLVAAGAPAGSVPRRRPPLGRRVSADVRVCLDVAECPRAERAHRRAPRADSTTGRPTATASSWTSVRPPTPGNFSPTTSRRGTTT